MKKYSGLIIFILVAIGIYASSSDNMSKIIRSEPDIPYEAVEYNGHHYHVFSNVCTTLEEAERFCENRGGHLVVISSEDENNRVNKIMRDSGYSTAFIGLSYDASRGTWGWVDRSDTFYVNWAPLEPTERSDWAYVRYDVASRGWANQASPNQMMEFICEWDK